MESVQAPREVCTAVLNKDTASLFNSTLAAASIAATFEVGLLDELAQTGSVRFAEFCAKHDLHEDAMAAVLYTLQGFDILDFDRAENVVRAGDLFRQTYHEKGYFSWLTGGYGYMLQNLGKLLRNQNRHGDFTKRDGGHIAMAGRDYGVHFVDGHFTEMVDGMPFSIAADIGCGSGDRLIQLARNWPRFRGVGIEMNASAVEVARREVRACDLADRITILHGDLRDMEATPECDEVEFAFSFFMGHDLWPRANCVTALRQIRSLFPRIKRFLLCDTYRSDALASGEVPIFTLGFELTHAVMGQFIPSQTEWREVIAESGWQCIEERPIGIPYSCIFDLRIPE